MTWTNPCPVRIIMPPFRNPDIMPAPHSIDNDPSRPTTGGVTPPGPDLFDPGHAGNQSEYIVVYGPGGKILFANPALLNAMGYAADQMTGTPLFSYVAEEFKKLAAANMEARKETGDTPLYEITLIAADGFRRSVIVKGKPVRYGDSPATLLFLIDITERKSLEDQLAARAEELLQLLTAYQLVNRKLTLLSTITRHDIGNQLAVIKGYLGILETEQADPKLTEYCTKSLAASDRIVAMIQFTSEYEKIGITAPVWQDCRGVVDEAAAQAPLGRITAKNDLPEGAEMFADPLIVKVFYNLMDNAVRYGGKITTIRFSLQDEGGKVVIVCEDDGDGVPAAEKERIFDRGFGRNTGLGLALSREILDITGISLKETGMPGWGARFEMAVPHGAWRTMP
jgi:PAS domain S-box-containing protein